MIETVDKQPLCEALTWVESDQAETLTWEHDQLSDPDRAKKAGIDDPTAALAEVEADIARIKLENARPCLELPQRLFDCAPWSEGIPDALEGVVQQRADWKRAPKDCKGAASTLFNRSMDERFRPEKPEASHPPTWTRRADKSVTGLDLDGERAYLADREVVSAWAANKQTWRRPLEGTFALLHASDGTLAAAGPRAVTGLDRASGEVRWTVPAPGKAPAIAAAAGANGIELLTADGTLVTVAVGAACKDKGAPACTLNPVEVTGVHKNTEMIGGDGVTVVNSGWILSAYGPDHALRFELYGYEPFVVAERIDAGHLVTRVGDKLLLLNLGACAAPTPLALEPSPQEHMNDEMRALVRQDAHAPDCKACAAPPASCVAASRRYPGLHERDVVSIHADGATMAVHGNGRVELLDASDLSLRWWVRSHGGTAPVPDGRGGWLVVGPDGEVDGFDAAGKAIWHNTIVDEHQQVWRVDQAHGPDGRVLVAIQGAHHDPDLPKDRAWEDRWRFRITQFEFGANAP